MEKEPSEIAKLTERISKDPKSKLFVPLAEEYKKAGDIEMAIHVLMEGLKNNPSYVTARSLLGRFLLETGDLESARKELEEVVKAIPDNLLAQRKLGDLYILQERRDEALEHYKIALSLNPGDKEFSSLISDVEAGADVRPRIQPQRAKLPRSEAAKPAAAPQPQPKPAAAAPLRPAAQRLSVAEPPVQTMSKVPQKPVQPEAAEQRAEKVGPEITKAPAESKETAIPAEKEVPEKAVEAPVVEQKPAEEAQAAKAEEPEEIVFVEPIGEELPAEEAPSAGLEAVTEKGGEGIPGFISEEIVADAVPVEPEPTVFEPVLEAETVQPAVEEKAAGLTPAGIATEPSEREPGPAPGQADDFTTDTLAELYIAQGFYEKAISIYERMLAEHPDSRALTDKLARVRAMAAQVEEPLTGPEAAGVSEKASGADTFAEAKEYVPSAPAGETIEEIAAPPAAAEELLPEPGTVQEFVPPVEARKKQEEEITIDAELFVEPEEVAPGAGQPETAPEEIIFAEAKEYIPPAEGGPPAEPALEKELGGLFGEQAEGEPVSKKPPYNDFEPREYIPPTASLREKPPEEKVPVEAKQPGVARKETIDRLEHWLKNIKKES